MNYPCGMAIEFARTHIISRGAGQSAVKSAAYRAGTSLHDERHGRNSDYSHRAADVGHSEILLPAGADAKYLDRETLWNAVEDREDQHNRRATAQLAKDHIIALPRELSREQQIEMAQQFAKEAFVSEGFAVDLNIHHHSDGNPHAHLMTTLRPVNGLEFGKKPRDSNGNFYKNAAKIPDEKQLRHAWSDFQNQYFIDHNIDLSVENNNGEFEPEKHLSQKQSWHPNEKTKAELEQHIQTVKGRAAAIYEKPEIIIERITARKSVFTRHDMYRELHKLVSDKEAFQAIKNKLDNHTSLISIKTDIDKTERFTTQRVVEDESNIVELGAKLSQEDQRFSVSEKHINAALAEQSFLSDEQKSAVRYTLEPNRLATVVGLAGAGKSTLLKSMRAAAVASGHGVHGIALAGKAAQELTESSDIESRTIASFLNAHKKDKIEIAPGDIIVMDEAGMVNNTTMLQVMQIVEQSGAKLVTVGDSEQLQPIQTGTPFKVMGERYGQTRVETIRRQQTDWQRQATSDLEAGRADKAISAYVDNGNVFAAPKQNTMDRLVTDYVAALTPDKSRAILAHRNKDVKEINAHIRERLKESGVIRPGNIFKSGGTSTGEGVPLGTEIGDRVIFDENNDSLGYEKGDVATYVGTKDGLQMLQLDDGAQLSFKPDNAPALIPSEEEEIKDIELSEGDRVLFTKNDSVLGVKNGMLGTLVSFDGVNVSIALDDEPEPIRFTADEYSNIEHGYATTIHKSQGMTVDHAYLLGSNSMDKHLGYVGMSRHRDSLSVYLPMEDFAKHSFADALSRSTQQESVLDIVDNEQLYFDDIDIGKTEIIDIPAQPMDSVIADEYTPEPGDLLPTLGPDQSQVELHNTPEFESESPVTDSLDVFAPVEEPPQSEPPLEQGYNQMDNDQTATFDSPQSSGSGVEVTTDQDYQQEQELQPEPPAEIETPEQQQPEIQAEPEPEIESGAIFEPPTVIEQTAPEIESPIDDIPEVIGEEVQPETIEIPRDIAESVLDAERLNIIEAMNADAELEIRDVEKDARIAERAVDEHEANEPKQGLLSNKKTHVAWEEKLDTLKAESVAATKQVSNLKTELSSSQEKFSRQARAEARVKHPAEAKALDAHKQKEKASSVMSKVDSLTKTIEESRNVDDKTVNSSMNKLGAAIENLSKDKEALKGMTEQDMRKIDIAKSSLADHRKSLGIEERSRGIER